MHYEHPNSVCSQTHTQGRNGVGELGLDALDARIDRLDLLLERAQVPVNDPSRITMAHWSIYSYTDLDVHGDDIVYGGTTYHHRCLVV